MNVEQGRTIVRKYAAELGVEELGEQFIRDGERPNNWGGEHGEYFWSENFVNADQIRIAFFEDYYSGSIFDEAPELDEVIVE